MVLLLLLLPLLDNPLGYNLCCASAAGIVLTRQVVPLVVVSSPDGRLMTTRRLYDNNHVNDFINLLAQLTN